MKRGRVAEAYFAFKALASILSPWQREADGWWRTLQPAISVHVAPGTPPIARVEIDRDHKLLSFDQPVAVDPGEHVVTIVYTDQSTRQRAVTVEAGKVATLHISPSDVRFPVGIGLLSTSALGIVGIFATAVVAASKKDVIDAHCNMEKRCDSAGAQAADTGKMLVGLNTVSWAVAVAGLGLGTYFTVAAKGAVQLTVGPKIAGTSPAGLILGFGGRF